MAVRCLPHAAMKWPLDLDIGKPHFKLVGRQGQMKPHIYGGFKARSIHFLL
jgi:hypothetical protein